MLHESSLPKHLVHYRINSATHSFGDTHEPQEPNGRPGHVTPLYSLGTVHDRLYCDGYLFWRYKL